VNEERRFSAASRLVLSLAIAFITYSAVLTAYRFSLPSDGWRLDLRTEEGRQQLVYRNSVSRQPSPLQAGDILLSAAGQTYAEMLSNAVRMHPERPQHWRLGETVAYRVLRGGEPLDLQITLVRRSFAELLRSRDWPFGYLTWFLVGALLFFLRPGNPAAQLLLLLGSVPIVSNVLGAGLEGPAEFFYPLAYWPTFPVVSVWTVAALPLFAHLFLVFPVVKAPMRRHPVLCGLALYGTIPVLLLGGLLFRSSDALFPAFLVAHSGGFALSLGTIALSSWRTLRTLRDPVGRAQLQWLLFGVIVSVGGGIGIFTLRAVGVLPQAPWILAIFHLVTLFFPVSLAIAVLRYRLWDIHLLINRALVYAALSLILAGVYFGSVTVLQGLLLRLSGQESPLAVALSTLAIAALFNPLRRRVQEFIDRRFYRQKYDARQTMEAFARQMRDVVDLPQLEREVLAGVSGSLRPEHLSLWLSKKGGDA
jgi:hypothetical protein